jgi:stage III sporulation protein AD
MDIFKIIGICFLALVLSIILKEYKKEYSVYVLVVCGIIIILYSIDTIKEIFSFVKNVSNNNFINLLLKITGISILSEYAMSICKDSGETSIASKIDFGSKIIIISLSIPIISNTLEILVKLLP